MVTQLYRMKQNFFNQLCLSVFLWGTIHLMSEQAIIPVEQREIEFYEDTVTAIVAPDGKVYVPLRPVCELIGVTWQGQRQRINRDPVLSLVAIRVNVTFPQIEAGRGKNLTREMIAIPLDFVNGFLFGINVNRVDESIREKLITYQLECYQILSDAFSTGIAVRQDEELLQSESPQGSAYRVALAVAKLAREQYYMGLKVEDNTRRIGLLEAQLSNPTAYVTQEQAQQISEAVKAIATVQGKRSGKNEFGGTYGELYRRYGITSYKHLPTAKFDHCITWLREWWTEITDDSDAPF